jgi:TonB family protein
MNYMNAKYTLILPMMIVSVCLRSQDTRMQTNKNGMGGSEIYYVSKEDKSREGPYTSTNRLGRNLISGFYSGGQKDSVWIFYGQSQKILSKHYYKKGIRTGVWEFYKNDELEWTYDFDSSKANFIQPEDTVKSARTYIAYQDEQGNWIHFPPEKHALPVSSDYLYVLIANLRYPDDAVNKNQQGQVKVAVLIDQQGNPESFEIGISSGYPSLDQEALRVMKLTHLEYIPAENKGVKVKSLALLDVNFRLEFH